MRVPTWPPSPPLPAPRLDFSSLSLYGATPLRALCDAAARGALPELAQLWLRFNPLTDEAAQVLCGAPHSPLARLLSPALPWKLEDLSLFGCLLGTAAAEQVTGELERARGAAAGGVRLDKLDLGGNDELLMSKVHLTQLRLAWKQRRAGLGAQGALGLKLDPERPGDEFVF